MESSRVLQTHGRVSPLSAVHQLRAVRAEGAFRGVGLPAVVLLVLQLHGNFVFSSYNFFETFIWANLQSSSADVPPPAFL